MNGGRRRSMLGKRDNLCLQPVKLNLPGKSGRKNRLFSILNSPAKPEQGVVKRLFDEPVKADKRSPLYTRFSSAFVNKDESPLKNSCSKVGKTGASTFSKSTPKESPRNLGTQSSSSPRNATLMSHSNGNSSKGEASKTSNSKFNLLNSSHYSHLNTAKTLKSPKSPILWSNATKYRRSIKMEPIKSPEEPELLSRTLNMLTSTAQKSTSGITSKGNEISTNYSKLESPHLSAIKIMKPVEKSGSRSVKNLYDFNPVDSSLNDIVLSDQTVNESTVMANRSNNDSFLDNETMCLMDADETVKNAQDSKETTLQCASASSSSNKIVAPTPRKLSVISEEGAIKREPVNFKPSVPKASDTNRLTALMNCVNDLMVSKENFLSEQSNLFEQMKLSQENFFSKQSDILTKVNDIVSKFNSVDYDKSSSISKDPPRNEIITSRIVGNGNDDDNDDLLSEDMNDVNNSLICATKKLKIFDENSETPRRSLRILDKVESAKKHGDKIPETPENSKAKGSSSYLSSVDSSEMMSDFKENSLRTPKKQRSGQKLQSSGSSTKFYSAKRLSGSTSKSSLRTPTCPRKSLADKTFSKYETPSKRCKNSPLERKSSRSTRTANLIKSSGKNSPGEDDTTILMKNLRRSCAFLKTPKNTNRMSINASNFLTPHSMSFVVQDQMKNIFSS